MHPILLTLYRRFDAIADELSDINPLNTWGRPAKTEAVWLRISQLKGAKNATVNQIQNFLKNS